MPKLAPIAFFVYNRPEHTKISLKALEKNILAKNSDLIIILCINSSCDIETSSSTKKESEILSLDSKILEILFCI